MSTDEYVVQEFDVDDLHVEIVADTDYSPLDTREEPLSEIVTWSYDRNGIGDRGLNGQEQEAMERGGKALLARYLRTACGALCVLPLSGIDHSGQSVRVAGSWRETSPFDTAGWDSGNWGFVVVFRSRADELGIPGAKGGVKLPFTWAHDGKTVTIETIEQSAEEQARAEVEELNDVMTGNVYGYRISRTGPDGALVEEDSCWGFVGDPEANVVPEARMAAEYMPRQQSLGLVTEGVSA